MRRHLPVVLALALCVPVPSGAQGQTAPEEQARRLLEDGRAYRTQGRNKQAFDNFQTIVTGFQGTDSVDEHALLEIGRYHAEVEHDFTKARDALDQVTKRFPQSDGAPGAYFLLGWLTLERATGPAEIEDALAQFDRVERLYSQSPWVAEALHAAGLAHRRAGRLPESVDRHRRVVLEYGTSPPAAASQFEVAHATALAGEYRMAMEEFQRVRNQFPQSPLAQRALERLTALWRLAGGERAVFELDASFNLAAGEALEDVRSLLATPGGFLWLLSDKVKSAVPFDPSGAVGRGILAEDGRTLGLLPSGEPLVVTRLAARFGGTDLRSWSIPTDKPGQMDPLDKIADVVPLRGGDVLVADEKHKRVYRFAGTEFKGTFPDPRDRDVTRLVVDGEGGIGILDADERSVRFYDERGQALRAISPRGTGYELKKPFDFAVDPMLNTYVADEQAGVLVFSPKGQLLATLGTGVLRKARAVTVDPTGAILVYDEKAKRVVRYR